MRDCQKELKNEHAPGVCRRLKQAASFMLVGFFVCVNLSTIQLSAQTWYSQGSLSFSTLSNWDNIPGGGGTNPIASDLTDGNSTFFIQNTHSINIDQDITVDSLTINSGGILTNDGFDIFMNSDLTNNSTAGGDADLSGGTTTFQGGSAQTISGVQKTIFSGLVVNNTGGLTVATSADVDLTILTITSGGFTSGSGKININNSVTHLTIVIDITAAADFSSGTLEFVGNRRSIVRSDRNVTFNNITINSTASTSGGNGAVDFRSNNGTTRTFTVNGTLSRTSGEPTLGSSVSQPVLLDYGASSKLLYNNGGATLTVSNEWPSSSTEAPNEVQFAPTVGCTYTINAAKPIPDGGKLVINGSIANPSLSAGTGSITYGSGAGLVFNGSIAHTVAFEWTTSQAIDSLYMNNSGGVTITSGRRFVNKVLTLNTGEIKHPSGGNDTLYLGGNLVGGLSGGGAYDTTALNGILAFVGSQNQLITGSSTINSIYVNKPFGTVQDDSTVTLGASAVTVKRRLVIERGRFLNSSGTLTVSDLSGSKIVINNSSIFELATGANNLTLPAVDANNSSSIITGGKTFFGHIAGQPVFTLATGSTFQFNGSTGETVPSTIPTYGKLKISNPGNVTLSAQNVIVDSVIFTSGLLVQEGNGSLTVLSGFRGESSTLFVAGAVRCVVVDNSTYRFPTGVQTGTKYRLATFRYQDFTGGANDTIEAKYFNSNPGGNVPPGVSSISTTAYYTLRRVGGTAPSSVTYDFTARYSDAGFNPESRNRLLLQNAALTTNPSYLLLTGETRDETADSIRVAGITAFPTNNQIITFGSGGAIVKWDAGAGDGQWTSQLNWDGDVLPGSIDDVVLDNSIVVGSYTATLSGSSAQTIQSLVIGDGAGNTVTLSITNTNATPITITALAGGSTDSLSVLSDGSLTINGTTGGISMLNNAGFDFKNLATLNISTGSGIATTGERTFGATSTTNVASSSSGALDPAAYGILNVTNSSGTISTSGNVSSQNFTKSGSGSLSISGDLAITGTLSKSGSGTLTVSGGNCSTTGSATVSGGVLTADGASGRFNIGTTTNTTGGTLTIAATATGNSTFTGAFTNGGTLILSGSGTTTFSNVLTNTNSITLNTGAGLVTVTGNYSGSGTISATGATPDVTFMGEFSPGGNATFGSQTLTFQGDVTLAGGVFTPSSTTNFSGSTLTLSGGTFSTNTGTFTFSSSAQQTIASTATFNNLTINNTTSGTNTNDLEVNANITINGTLTLTDGVVDMNTNTLILPSGAVSTTGSATSYINGKISRTFSSSATNLTFQIGKAKRFQPVTIQGSSVSGNPTIILDQIESNNPVPLTTGINSPLLAVSRVRYWTMAYTAGGGSITSPTIRLSWNNDGTNGPGDGVANAPAGSSTSADVVVAQQSNGAGNWNSVGQSAFTGTYATGANTNAGTVTSNVSAGPDGGTLTLTDGNTDYVTFAGLNSDVSLPVELTLFAAEELENAGHVKLVWRTESEIENAYWFVQKKTPNSDFVSIATIDGQGSKTSSTDY
ncbi:hypothetical protein JNM05_03515, partial [bacterium]|nr:hypothetical protein [bacterium]